MFKFPLAVVAACLLLSHKAMATIFVQWAPTNSTSFQNLQPGTDYQFSGNSLYVRSVALNGSKKIRVYSDAGENIPAIVLDTGGNNSTGVEYQFILGNATAILGADLPFQPAVAAGNNWAGFLIGAGDADRNYYNVKFQGRITGDLTGPVVLRNLIRLDVGGSQTPGGYIEHVGSQSTGPHMGTVAVTGDVPAAAVSTRQMIRSDHGNIGRVSVGGDLIGNVEALDGAIGSVEVTGLISGAVWSKTTIESITCASIARMSAQLDPGQSGFRAQIDSTGSGGSGDDYWAIENIQVAGDIGTPSDLVFIRTKAGPAGSSPHHYANGGIKRLQARSAYVDIETPLLPGGGTPSVTNPRGDILQIVLNQNNADTSATAGVLAGTVRTFSFGYSTLNQTPSLEMWGQLQGQILIDGTFKQPVQIHRGVAAGGMVSLLEKDLAVDNEGIEVTGDMAGRIEIEGNKNAPITIDGDLSGTVEIGRSVRNGAATSPDYGGRVAVTGSITTTGVVTVGGTVLNTPGRVEIDIDGDMAGQVNIGKTLAGQIEIGPGGLQGQVIINQNNGAGVNQGVWEGGGTVTVGAVTLSHDSSGRYATPASSIGGGAVGLAPFRLYEGDCSPPHNTFASTPKVLTSQFWDTSNYPVKIVAYGPLRLTPGFIDPDGAVMIEVQNPNTPCEWHDMTQLGFGLILFGPAGTSARTIGLRGNGSVVPPDGIYRVTAGAVSCGRVTGDPLPVWSPVTWSTNPPCSSAEVYTFRIYPDCDKGGAGNGQDDS